MEPLGSHRTSGRADTGRELEQRSWRDQIVQLLLALGLQYRTRPAAVVPWVSQQWPSTR